MTKTFKEINDDYQYCAATVKQKIKNLALKSLDDCDSVNLTKIAYQMISYKNGSVENKTYNSKMEAQASGFKWDHDANLISVETTRSAPVAYNHPSTITVAPGLSISAAASNAAAETQVLIATSQYNNGTSATKLYSTESEALADGIIWNCNISSTYTSLANHIIDVRINTLRSVVNEMNPASLTELGSMLDAYFSLYNVSNPSKYSMLHIINYNNNVNPFYNNNESKNEDKDFLKACEKSLSMLQKSVNAANSANKIDACEAKLEAELAEYYNFDAAIDGALVGVAADSAA